MALPDWDELTRRWAEDEGALVDIRVPNASVDEWRRVVETAGARWSLSLEEDGKSVPMPSDLDGIFDPTGPFRLLRVALTPLINLNAHLPDEEIEFDFDPKEVLDQADLDAIVDFVLVVGRAVRRTVHVLVESGELGTMDDMRYDDATDRVVVVG